MSKAHTATQVQTQQDKQVEILKILRKMHAQKIKIDYKKIIETMIGASGGSDMMLGGVFNIPSKGNFLPGSTLVCNLPQGVAFIMYDIVNDYYVFQHECCDCGQPRRTHLLEISIEHDPNVLFKLYGSGPFYCVTCEAEQKEASQP